MSSLLHRRPVLLVGGGVALAMPFVRPGRAQQTYEWLAGSVGGGWYGMAAGLAALVGEENADIRIRVSPGGGLANSSLVNRNQAPIGWGIDSFAASARRGAAPYAERHENLRSLGTGYSPTEHHLLRPPGAGPEEARAILTQKGLKLAAPQRSSTDEVTLQRILRFLGTSPERIVAEGGAYRTGSYADMGNAFSDGQVDYLYVALARPAAIVTEIAQGPRGGRLVAFPDDIRDHLVTQHGHAEGVIPAATYPQLQPAAVPVTMTDSVIMVHESLPDDVAYRITRTLIRNKGERMARIHASMAAWDPRESARYTGLPLHPGAARAFREAGVL